MGTRTPSRASTTWEGRPALPAGLSEYFGTAQVYGDPSHSFGQRAGRCYELSAYALTLGDSAPPVGSRLVHGTIDGGPGTLGRIGHAWLLLPGGELWEPILARVFPGGEWLEWADALVERVYSVPQARSLMVSSGHYGRWHESEYR